MNFVVSNIVEVIPINENNNIAKHELISEHVSCRRPDMELNVFRWVFMIIPLSVYFFYTKTSPSIPKEKIPHVLFYSLLVSGEQVTCLNSIVHF